MRSAVSISVFKSLSNCIDELHSRFGKKNTVSATSNFNSFEEKMDLICGKLNQSSVDNVDKNWGSRTPHKVTSVHHIESNSIAKWG
ncbi:hypothetical protein Hanom_Chr16g01417591 [Helianthus anomalus]